ADLESRTRNHKSQLPSDSNPPGDAPEQSELRPGTPAEILPPAPGLRQPRVLSENPVWTGWDIALLIVVFFVALLAVTWTALPVAHRVPSMRRMSAMAVLQKPIVIICIEGVAEFAVLLFMVWLVRLSYRRPFWPALRWNFPHARWAAFLTIGFALALALAPFESGLEKVVPSPKQLPID